MPSATHDPTTFLGPLAPPRRLLLALAGLGPIAAFPAVASAISADGDAALIRIGARFDPAAAKWQEALDLCEREDTPENEAAANAARAVTAAIVHEIETLQACTTVGLQVKLRALLWCGCGDLPSAQDLAGPFTSQPTTDMRLIAGILQDIHAMGGA
jgi:hypothetical protein